MTPRQRTKRRRPSAVPQFRRGQLLDWSSSRHWNYDGPAPCRYCGQLAFLLDSGGHPAHKVHAEQALATQYEQTLAEYQGAVL